jgi:hypothetical protein
MMQGDFTSRRVARRLALSGKLDLRPAYFVMAAALAVSYMSRLAYSHAYESPLVSRICAFGMRHISGVRDAAPLSVTPEATSFVVTIQWLLVPIYLLVFLAFLSPFTKIARVAVDKAVKLESCRVDSYDKKQLMQVIALVLGVLVLLGDVKLINFPTFFNGGLYVIGRDQRILLTWLDSNFLMPALSWVTAFGTFMFYWGCLHLAANFKTVFDL